MRLMTVSLFQRPLRPFSFLAAAISLAAWPLCASAQLQLPGAFNPAPAGTTTAAPAGGVAKPKPKKVAPAAPKVPSDDSVLGRTLMLNGKSGSMEFRREGKDLQIWRLKLAGDMISKPGDACQIDLSSAPIALKPAGRPAGVNRYQLDIPDCAASVDILEGAALARTEGGGACEFKAADCRADPAGLWGQPASEIGPQRSKEIEGQRHRAESDMRAAFKTWIAGAKGDRKLVSRIAREQAAFSSKREELCRSYARESQHGYCDLVATQARTSSIAARVLPPAEPEEEKPAKARKAGKR